MVSPAPPAIVATNLRLDTPAGVGVSFCLVLFPAVIVLPPSRFLKSGSSRLRVFVVDWMRPLPRRREDTNNLAALL